MGSTSTKQQCYEQDDKTPYRSQTYQFTHLEYSLGVLGPESDHLEGELEPVELVPVLINWGEPEEVFRVEGGRGGEILAQSLFVEKALKGKFMHEYTRIHGCLWM